MRIAVMGISMKASMLEEREAFAKAALKIFERDLLDALLLSTCHRTEIYFTGADLLQKKDLILARLESESPSSFQENLYCHFEAECFEHLALVVSGLDSMIVGETEIHKQVKRAYENALLYRNLPRALHFLFQKCFKIAKEVRSMPIFPRGQRNLESSLFQLYKNHGKGKLLFVGNSAINRKILSYFRKKGVGDLTLCTRAPHSASEIVEAAEITLIDWTKISSWQEFSFVICGTNQPEYLLAPEQIRGPLQTKMIVDLCVPRNVDPRLGEKLSLVNIEEMGRYLQIKEGKFAEEADQCREKARLLAARQLALFARKEEYSSDFCLSH